MSAHSNQRKDLSWTDLLKAARVLLTFITENRAQAWVLLLLGLTSALLGAVVPYAVGRFVDGLISLGSETPVSWYVPLSLWFLVTLCSALIDWVLGLRATKLGNHVYATSAHRWYSYLLGLPISFHKEQKGGETLNKISRSSGYASQLVDNILLNIGPQILSMVIGICFALFLQPILAGVIIFGMVVYATVSIRAALPLAQLQLANNKAWHEAYGDTYDLLGSIHAVKQATAEGFAERKMYEGFVVKASVASNTSEMIWVKIRFFQRLSVVFTQLAVFAGSVWFVTSGDLSVGSLVALNGYSAMVFGPLASLAMNWNTIQNGLTNIYEVQGILSRDQEVYERAGAPTAQGGAVVFDHVSFAYPDAPERTVLRDVSFSIHDGETVAFVGESGVGKSTAIELMGGYYFPMSGHVRVGNVSTSDVSLRQLREMIAVVPQEPVLFNDTVLNNIRFGRRSASDEEVVAAAQQAFAHDFIDSFPEKYEQLVGERGVKLSVGQKQRIAIARAILRNPKILILDEPTSALDAKTESQITASLEQLMQGRTTIIIAHRLSTVRKASNIVVFEEGTVAEQGTHQELIQKNDGVYKKLYEYQIGLHS
ncbi:MAG: ABC transporter ATP-binding protein [Candidatus Pacebacteria bacterium]|nr:ABC transporter ATP-binding protein [Candidatus Paceibacterota bacterium]